MVKPDVTSQGSCGFINPPICFFFFLPALRCDVTNASSVNMDPNATILRVKRKRGTDPADALLLACKRIRPEAPQSPGGSAAEPAEEVESSVFKLVATVATQVRGPDDSSMVCTPPPLSPGWVKHT